MEAGSIPPGPPSNSNATLAVAFEFVGPVGMRTRHRVRGASTARDGQPKAGPEGPRVAGGNRNPSNPPGSTTKSKWLTLVVGHLFLVCAIWRGSNPRDAWEAQFPAKGPFTQNSGQA